MTGTDLMREQRNREINTVAILYFSSGADFR
jgi:hypothetical protein